MGFISSVIWFFAVLTPVVFFHELGHLWAARRSGVRVEVFSVGFGREIFGYTDRHNTRWKFSLIPLGGYVKMFGDSDEASTPSAETSHLKGSFHSASLGAKAFIVAMGPIANFILGILIIAMVYIGVGKVVIPNEVGEVIQGSAAHEAGLEAGDRITEIGGYTIREFSDIRGIVFENPGRSLTMKIERDGIERELTLIPSVVEDACLGLRYGQLGVRSAQGELKSFGIGAGVAHASVDSFRMGITMLRGIGRFFSGNANQGEIGGPIKIADLSGRVASQGFISLMMFTAILSINLGLINLLPFPALDGGHLMFFALEKIMGRPLPQKLQEWILKAGVALLITLILVVTFYDVLGIFNAEC